MENVNVKGKPVSVQIINGKLEVTYPVELASAEFVYPKPW